MQESTDADVIYPDITRRLIPTLHDRHYPFIRHRRDLTLLKKKE